MTGPEVGRYALAASRGSANGPCRAPSCQLAGRIHLSFTMILPKRTRCRMLPGAFATGDPKQGSRHRVMARKVGSGWVANRPRSKGCGAESVEWLRGRRSRASMGQVCP